MFQKVLIANRGEIAVRIIRACKQLGIATVAIYSDVDKESLHVQIADEAVCVGGAKSSESYLHMENIVSAAIETHAEAIHPGFGFLSENADFAELCHEVGLRFIGPQADVIRKMGNKSEARKTMIEAGVPVVPGSKGIIKSVEHLKELADEIGLPVLIKASSGGGGRGMRIAYTRDELVIGYETAKSEAKNAFGDDQVYLEKFVENPKHIEFQILADKYGHVIHLAERDCSVQRRNQKVVEESPSLISDDLRQQMGESAIKAAKAVKYENAGTIEFLVSQGKYYFIEMNTRIQVEHPVTEMVTGVDLIKEQIRIASGEKLLLKQSDITVNGHAIECRINAEDPNHNFRPSPGTVELLHVPNGFGVRFDSFLYTGYTVSPYYDSLVGKLIVHDHSREAALMKMRNALDELIIEGFAYNRSFCRQIISHKQFRRGDFDTSFIAKYKDMLIGDDYE
ncbi:MAG: acetyl-CoA carboxylase biotin carboxylase subunit [Candidatus Izemoplasma sp.]|nr:acetyl-CoA carboxylase biotin carboxylase subunit [Candidatus Izemoplasma sp.]